MSRLRFVEAEKAQHRNVAKACELLEVSRSAFYDFAQHRPSARQLADEALSERIADIFDASRGTYGWPGCTKRCGTRASTPAASGWPASWPRRASSAAAGGDGPRPPSPIPRPGQSTCSSGASGPRPSSWTGVYVSDITYVWTWEGWLYLASVIDLASRRAVGWAMADHMRTELVADALRMAIAARRPEPGLIFHSDRGTQYTSSEFTDLLAEHQMVQPLSRRRQCWDNAVAESWFGTLKEELIHGQSWATRAQARSAIVDYIEVFYNRRRLHSSLGYLSPADYEARRRARDAASGSPAGAHGNGATGQDPAVTSALRAACHTSAGTMPVHPIAEMVGT